MMRKQSLIENITSLKNKRIRAAAPTLRSTHAESTVTTVSYAGGGGVEALHRKKPPPRRHKHGKILPLKVWASAAMNVQHSSSSVYFRRNDERKMKAVTAEWSLEINWPDDFTFDELMHDFLDKIDVKESAVAMNDKVRMLQIIPLNMETVRVSNARNLGPGPSQPGLRCLKDASKLAKLKCWFLTGPASAAARWSPILITHMIIRAENYWITWFIARFSLRSTLVPPALARP
jgi:hypothetical protein